MSAGAFEIGKYESTETGFIHPIRAQEETKALVIDTVTNAYPAGAIDIGISAQSSQSKRALGVNARTVTIKFPTAAPTGYKVDSPITVPWFAEAGFAGLLKGATGTYLGSSCVVVGKSPERVN